MRQAGSWPLMRPILFFVWWRVNILYENLDFLFLFFLIVFKVLNHTWQASCHFRKIRGRYLSVAGTRDLPPKPDPVVMLRFRS